MTSLFPRLWWKCAIRLECVRDTINSLVIGIVWDQAFVNACLVLITKKGVMHTASPTSIELYLHM